MAILNISLGISNKRTAIISGCVDIAVRHRQIFDSSVYTHIADQTRV